MLSILGHPVNTTGIHGLHQDAEHGFGSRQTAHDGFKTIRTIWEGGRTEVKDPYQNQVSIIEPPMLIQGYFPMGTLFFKRFRLLSEFLPKMVLICSTRHMWLYEQAPSWVV